jgi:hypothetical protein
MVKHRRKKSLAVVGIVVVFCTFLFGKVFTDALKGSVDSLADDAAGYRRELGTSTVSTQIANLQLEISAASEKGALAEPSNEKNYSPMILEDLSALEQRRSQLNVDMDDMSRLLDALPAGAVDLRDLRERVKVFVDKANRDVDELKKPGQTDDWKRAFKVKLEIIPVMVAELGVVVVGDAVLTRVEQVHAAREKIYHFCLWTGYLLYTLGIILAIYGVLSGFSVGVGED